MTGETFVRTEAEAGSRQGWKVAIAKRLRKETTAKNPWIGERLNMGHPNYVSNPVNKDEYSLIFIFCV